MPLPNYDANDCSNVRAHPERGQLIKLEVELRNKENASVIGIGGRRVQVNPPSYESQSALPMEKVSSNGPYHHIYLPNYF